MTLRLRVAAAALLVATGLVPLNLYLREHYREIPTVGWLFFLTVLSAATLALAVLVRPGWLTDLSAVLFSLSVLAGYLLTLWLPQGLFHFKELGVSYSGVISIAAEAGTASVLTIALLSQRRNSGPALAAPQPSTL